MKAEGDTEHKQGLFNYKFPVSDLGGADLNDLVAQVWARDVANKNVVNPTSLFSIFEYTVTLLLEV